MAETSSDVVKRYLQDVIAAEKNFETQLHGFAGEANNAAAREAFYQHALETKNQYERLTARLESLGGNPPIAKSLLAHIFGLGAKATEAGREKDERTIDDLMIAFAVEHSEMAIYEALAATAEAAGDPDTASLARSVQQQEKETAEKIWKLLHDAALDAYQAIAGEGVARAKAGSD